MALLNQNTALQKHLDRLFHNSGESGITIKLYTNDKTPALSDTAASYTASTHTTSVDIERTDFSSATVDTGVATTQHTAVTFTSDGTETVYGYFVISQADSTIEWAERFSSEKELVNGSTIVLTPKYTFANAS